MVYNVYEVINLIICLILVFYASFKFNLSNKILYLLLAHLALVFFIDSFLDYWYWPDQFRYFWAASEFRDYLTTSENSGSVVAASFMFSLTPVFVTSVKSIAFVNFQLYFILLMFFLKIIKSSYALHKFKLFYFLYPSLILFTSLGLRDFLITFFMFFGLYFLIIQDSYVKASLFSMPLYFIKGQNFFLIILVMGFHAALKIKNIWMRALVFAVYIFLVFGWAAANWALLLNLRQAMFMDDTGLSAIYMEDWSYVDVYRILFAPFFFDARNAMQLIQSVENLGVAIVIYKLIKLARQFRISSFKFYVINFFGIVSTLLYSLVVFNYGTVTRYKFPFVFCWIALVIILIDRSILEEQLFSSVNKSKRVSQNK